MLKTIALIFIGGGIGSSFRYLNSLFVAKYYPTQFPLGTLLTNIVGCLLIGLLLGMAEKQNISSPDFKFFIITGFCGGFTTFSAFSSESLGLMQNGQSLLALLYIAASLFIGILATWLGLYLTRPV